MDCQVDAEGRAAMEIISLVGGFEFGLGQESFAWLRGHVMKIAAREGHLQLHSAIECSRHMRSRRAARCSQIAVAAVNHHAKGFQLGGIGGAREVDANRRVPAEGEGLRSSEG